MTTPTFNDLVNALMTLQGASSTVERDEIINLLLKKLKEILEK